MVGGVTPGKGGTLHLGLPVFDTVDKAVAATEATASAIYVPPPFAADAILEAIDARVALVVCITEGIPVLDMVRVKRAPPGQRQPRLIGPNCPGIITPRRMQDRHHARPYPQPRAGRHRLALRHPHYMRRWLRPPPPDSGNPPASASAATPVNGTSFVDCLEMFLDDPETEAIIMIGEIGGNAEEDAAALLKSARRKKPTVGFIAAGPRPRAVGWAMRARSSRAGRGGAEDKIEAMKSAGITVADSPASLGSTMLRVLKG